MVSRESSSEDLEEKSFFEKVRESGQKDDLSLALMSLFFSVVLLAWLIVGIIAVQDFSSILKSSFILSWDLVFFQVLKVPAIILGITFFFNLIGKIKDNF